MTREPDLTDRDVGDAELRRVAQRLGARAADTLDEAAVARAVVERLREPEVVPLRRGVRRLPLWLRLAAAVVILAGAGIVAGRGLATPEQPTRFVTADLVGLDAGALSELLQTMDDSLESVEDPGGGGLEQLNAEQLEAMLRAVEG